MLRKELAESVLEVKGVSDRLMAMKLEVNGSILNIVSAYAPQVNNITEEKNDFWEDLDGLIESISTEERIVLGADNALYLFVYVIVKSNDLLVWSVLLAIMDKVVDMHG